MIVELLILQIFYWIREKHILSQMICLFYEHPLRNKKYYMQMLIKEYNKYKLTSVDQYKHLLCVWWIISTTRYERSDWLAHVDIRVCTIWIEHYLPVDEWSFLFAFIVEVVTPKTQFQMQLIIVLKSQPLTSFVEYIITKGEVF